MTVLGYYAGTAYDLAGWVTTDRPCRACGANLLNQHVGGRCPECGEPVGASVYGDLLAYADPNWLGVVRKGLRTIWWTTIIGVVVGIVIMAVVGIVSATAASQQIASGAATRPGAASSFNVGFEVGGSGWVQLPSAVVLIALELVFLRGIWSATEADPRRPDPDPDALLRKRTRAVSVAAAAKTIFDQIVGVCVAFAYTGASMAERQAVAQHPILLASGVITNLLFVGSAVAFALHLARLAARIPELALAGRARLAGLGVTAAFVLMMGLGLLIVLLAGQLDPSAAGPGGFGGIPNPSLMAAGCVSALAGLALLGFGVLYWAVVGQTATQIGRAREYAESVWRQPFGAAAVSAPVPPGGVLPPTVPPPPTVGPA